MRKRGVLRVVTLGAVAAAVTATASAALSPSAVYRALLVRPFPAAQLPAGFSSPRVAKAALSATAMGHHAVGAVRVRLNGERASILYVVFPSRTDALADWDAWAAQRQDEWMWVDGAPPGLPWPAQLRLGAGLKSAMGDAAFVSGITLVEAVTTMSPGAAHYNEAATLALARAANAHLLSVER